MGHSDTQRLMHRLFNDRDFASMTEHLADDVTLIDVPSGGTYRGPEEAIDYLAEWARGFSTATVADASYLEGPGHSVCFFLAKGRNDGEFAGMPPTNETIAVPFCEVATYAADGRTETVRFYYDAVTIMTQLGILIADDEEYDDEFDEEDLRTTAEGE
ncbi:ester cyclase [Nocardioides sp. GY 10113]|uniref:ester cyclase n=1 Tax=Nocardioides sp. GY 10113 TaxID=2569761 RepID=UPI0014585AB4|nr:ester cyclase [Nocardioides sp. GY 10113]